MGRAPCCDKANVKKGPWSPEEDAKLKEYIDKNGTGGNWIALPQKVGLRRCGKSCRLRWLNYLRPNIKHGEFSDEEDRIICSLYATIGSRWSVIAGQLAGRTDNDIKNYWNTKLKKKLMPPINNPLTTESYQSYSCPNLLYPSPNTPFLQNPPNSLYSYNPSFVTTTPFIHASNNNQVLSCSSSDGSNQISTADHNLWYFSNGVDENQRLSDGYSSSSSAAVNYGCFGDTTPHDYYSSIQEIKELISSSNSNNFSFIMDDIKTEENVVDY
ncbi:hypothetical protein ACS0TY_015856 [Phlomoides rotata]